MSYIASAFANPNTATLALASLIRYLRLKNVRFDIVAPNQFYSASSNTNIYKNDDTGKKRRLPVPVSETLFSNPESWVRFGKAIYGIDDAPLPATSIAPAAPIQQATALTTHLRAIFQAANGEATLAAWLDEDPQRLHWRDPDGGHGLLHLAAAHQHVGLVRLLLDRGIARTHTDHAGRTAAQLLPADYMSSYTPAAKTIADLLR